MGFWKIFTTFFLIGIQLLGGGYVILPLLQNEIVDRKKWISSCELVDFYALSQSIPGIISANISIFIGYKLKGIMGAIAAIFGVLTPAFLSIICIATLLSKLVKIPFVQGVLWGVGVAVVILLYLSVKEMWSNSVVDKFSGCLFAVVLLVALFVKVTPAIILLGAVLVGVLYKMLLRGNSR